MSDTDQDIAELRDELNALGAKLQRQIDDLNRYLLTMQDSVLQLQTMKRNELAAQLAAVPVPQSLRA